MLQRCERLVTPNGDMSYTRRRVASWPAQEQLPQETKSFVFRAFVVGDPGFEHGAERRLCVSCGRDVF
jgi:hypothetical protein